jgi:hypothetical protein
VITGWAFSDMMSDDRTTWVYSVIDIHVICAKQVVSVFFSLQGFKVHIVGPYALIIGDAFI